MSIQGLTQDIRDPLNVVVVDDDPCVVAIISRMLKKHFGDSVSVDHTCDAEKAVGLCIGKDVALCLSDLDMPGRNGFSLLQTVKRRNPLQQVTILTMHPSENAIRSAFALGASDYLVKPVNETVLVASVRFCLDRTRRLRTEMIASTPI